MSTIKKKTHILIASVNEIIVYYETDYSAS